MGWPNEKRKIIKENPSKYLPAELVVLSEEPLEGPRYGAFCTLWEITS